MIKIGTTDIDCPANVQLQIEGQSEFLVALLDKKGEVAEVLGRSDNRELKLKVRNECKIRILIDENQFMSINSFPIQSVYEEVSSIPVEIPDDKKKGLTMMEKMKLYLHDMVAERYGEDSQQYDTFEDAMDFDDEGEDPIQLSGYEMTELIPEEVIEDAGQDTGLPEESRGPTDQDQNRGDQESPGGDHGTAGGDPGEETGAKSQT